MRIPIPGLAIALVSAAPAFSQASFDSQRGRLLYETQCSSCHTAQAHWRDKRVVQSWSGLLQQVTRWEKAAGQNWSAQDIGDVAAYLNGAYYRMPCPLPGCEGPRAERGKRDPGVAAAPALNRGSAGLR